MSLDTRRRQLPLVLGVVLAQNLQLAKNRLANLHFLIVSTGPNFVFIADDIDNFCGVGFPVHIL